MRGIAAEFHIGTRRWLGNSVALLQHLPRVPSFAGMSPRRTRGLSKLTILYPWDLPQGSVGMCPSRGKRWHHRE